MSLTPSNMMPLGTFAPAFSLPDVRTGETVSLTDITSDKATVVAFICNHCPYVIHIIDSLSEFAKTYAQQGVSFVAICSNDMATYPDDSPEKMAEFARENALTFPYLHDDSQEVAKAYDAACTPDFFVFDGDLKCVYRGRYDASSPGKDVKVDGSDLAAALDDTLAGRPVTGEQKPSMGCNIKWK
jgi:peroxiredoxin